MNNPLQFIAPLIGGLLGTLAMSALLFIPAKLGLGRVDIIRAVGAFVTGNREHAFKPGLIIHFIVGIVFAYIYYYTFAFMHIPISPLHGLFAGAVHGVLVMLVVAIAVLEHHPMKRYQRRGPMTGFAQIIGHAVYGLIVGAVCGALAPLDVSTPAGNVKPVLTTPTPPHVAMWASAPVLPVLPR